MAKKQHGGKRKNAGRKPIPEAKRKIVVQIYEPGEVIEAAGGIEVAKELASKAINKVAKIS